MKNIKTYEGFFDFLKKKKTYTEPIYLDDIKECLLDLTEEISIENSLDGINNTPEWAEKIDFHSYDKVFNTKRGMSLDHDHEDLMNDALGIPNYIKGNMMAVRITYRPTVMKQFIASVDDTNNISHEKVKRLLDICSSKLKTYDCITSFYLSWGYITNAGIVSVSTGNYKDKEYKTTDDLFRDIINLENKPNITIKITTPSEIKL